MAAVGFLLPLLTLSLLITLSLTFPVTGKPPTEKLSHFQVYWHDILSGTNPSSIRIVNPPSVNNVSSTSPNAFGSINVIDNPMTEKPEIGLKLLGRAQGFYGVASKDETSVLMAMNFVFITGKYNGSTLTVLGRNQVNQKMREMPVIGGSGLFRFARGYVHATTYSYNPKTRNVVVRYNVYVLHY